MCLQNFKNILFTLHGSNEVSFYLYGVYILSSIDLCFKFQPVWNTLNMRQRFITLELKCRIQYFEAKWGSTGFKFQAKLLKESWAWNKTSKTKLKDKKVLICSRSKKKPQTFRVQSPWFQVTDYGQLLVKSSEIQVGIKKFKFNQVNHHTSGINIDLSNIQCVPFIRGENHGQSNPKPWMNLWTRPLCLL